MKNIKFIITLIAVAAWFTPAVANARNPISPFCVAHIANATVDGHTKNAHLDECAICEAQRDNNWPELGNINNETCQGLAKMIAPGKAAKCENGWSRGMCVAFQRCLAVGAEDGKGGIAFAVASLPTPPGERPVVDKDALDARKNAVVNAQDALTKAQTDALKAGQEVEQSANWLIGRKADKPKLKKPVRSPTWVEGIGITASTGVVGAIGGSGISALAGGAVLTTGLLTGGIGLGVGALGVIIWKGVSHESATATPVVAPTAVASP